MIKSLNMSLKNSQLSKKSNTESLDLHNTNKTSRECWTREYPELCVALLFQALYSKSLNIKNIYKNISFRSYINYILIRLTISYIFCGLN